MTAPGADGAAAARRLPLDPLALLAEPVIKATVGAHLATPGLDPVTSSKT